MLSDLLDGDVIDRPFGEHLLRRGNQGIHGPLLARIHATFDFDLHAPDLTGETQLIETIAIDCRVG